MWPVVAQARLLKLAGRCWMRSRVHSREGSAEELRLVGFPIYLRCSSRFRTVSSKSPIIHRILTTTFDKRFDTSLFTRRPQPTLETMYEVLPLSMYLALPERLKGYAQD